MTPATATQPGWDIQVTDDNGTIIELMSLKATEHVHYVKEALERYPGIDVVSTTETYAAMAGTPEGAHVLDGGFANVDLTDHVSSAADGHADGFGTAGLSLLALLPAAYRHFWHADRAANEQTSAFVEDVSRAKTAVLVGKTAMMAVPYWPVALLASVGISMLARVGDDRREQYLRLNRVLEAVRAESRRLRQLGKVQLQLGR